MSEQSTAVSAGPQLSRFKVQGLDCQNEVRALQAAVGPIVGGSDKLAFDTKAATMNVYGGASAAAVMAAVATTGMSATPAPAEAVLSFEVQGLDCQNEMRQLRAAVGPLVGGEHKLAFDTSRGLMDAMVADASAQAIIDAVATTGMRATLRSNQPRGGALQFRVKGLDCQNEVRQLKNAVGPLVGGEERLSFDTKTGRMDVAPQSIASAEAIKVAVASTGMVAELWSEEPRASQSNAAAADASCTSCAGDLALTAPLPAAAPDHVVFKIHGMDCGDEVAVLKREVGSLVGEDKLAFDLINGRMSVGGNPDPATIVGIEKAVARTGMHAEPWTEGVKTEGSLAEDRRRRLQSFLTAASGLLTAVGFTIHATAADSILAALSETPGVFAPAPLAAIRHLHVGHRVRGAVRRAEGGARGPSATARHESPHGGRGCRGRRYSAVVRGRNRLILFCARPRSGSLESRSSAPRRGGADGVSPCDSSDEVSRGSRAGSAGC
jgi:Cd2+/Zn2+-exporting ATPase